MANTPAGRERARSARFGRGRWLHVGRAPYRSAVDFRDYSARVREWNLLGDLVEYGRVAENGRDYPLLRLTVPGERWLTITSGFHGDEQSGPLTLLEYMPAIAEVARSRGVGLRVYPCINPSGFEAHTRYNASGERPNNDLLRYEISPGVWVGELRAGQQYLRWKPHAAGPKETRELIADLERFPAPHAALDIHQDRWLQGRHVYAYTFGDRRAYRPLVARSAALARVAANTIVDDASGARTDAEGLIEYNDGSVTDYFLRRGVPWEAALETTVDNPLEVCARINLLWIRGFIELAAGLRLGAEAESPAA